MEHTNVKILAISDVPSKALWDYDTRARLEGIDLILSCGDLPKKYLEYLTNFTAAPILYVHGNHDGSYQTQGEPGGCICVDDQVYTWKGLRIMGLGGCQRYNKEDTYQYTEKAMRRRVHKLKHQAHKRGGIDLLLTHAPAKGLNDGDDCAHRGFECFNEILDEYQPKWLSTPPSAMCSRSRTRHRPRSVRPFGGCWGSEPLPMQKRHRTAVRCLFLLVEPYCGNGGRGSSAVLSAAL